jgi:hypothetical protein
MLQSVATFASPRAPAVRALTTRVVFHSSVNAAHAASTSTLVPGDGIACATLSRGTTRARNNNADTWLLTFTFSAR